MSEKEQTFKEIHQQRKAEAVMQKLAQAINLILRSAFGGGLGFVLVTFRIEEGVASYVSNGPNDIIVKSLRETADLIEAAVDPTKSKLVHPGSRETQ